MSEESGTKNVADTKVRTYNVLIDSTDVGWCDEPVCKVEQQLLPVKLSQLMEQEVDARVIGTKVTVTLRLREINKAHLARCFPWYAAGAVELAPGTLGTTLYQHAKAVVLHPRDMGDATEDVTLDKAVATGNCELKGDGSADGAIPLELLCFPDHAELPTVKIGRIGS